MNDNVLEFRPRTSPPPTHVPLPTPSRRETARAAVALGGDEGITARDIAERYGLHHGKASSVLSALHKEGEIVRLAEKRLGFSIYVSHLHVKGRATLPYGSSTTTRLLDDVEKFLSGIPRCRHKFWNHGCTSCEGRLLLARIERTRK